MSQNKDSVVAILARNAQGIFAPIDSISLEQGQRTTLYSTSKGIVVVVGEFDSADIHVIDRLIVEIEESNDT